MSPEADLQTAAVLVIDEGWFVLWLVASGGDNTQRDERLAETDCNASGRGIVDEQVYKRLLTEGVEAWNRDRTDRAQPPDLRGARLIEVSLAGADLRGVDLREAQLMGADLTGADLRQAHLDESNLMGARLDRTLLEGASLTGAILQGLQAPGANLARLDLRKAKLAGANLRGADLSRALLDEIVSGPVRLDEANLAGASLCRANLANASLGGANLSGADLSEASLLQAWASKADFSGARLAGADLSMADLSEARLIDADLTHAKLNRTVLLEADLSGAHLSGAVLAQAQLMSACLAGVDLSRVDLSLANLSFANLRGATLFDTNLSGAQLVRTDFTGARLRGALVFGTAVWEAILDDAEQRDLRVTRLGQPPVAVDNLDVAQFVYLLLASARLRGVLEAATSKVVLLLGRFSDDRKALLDKLRDALRQRGWVAILFDFDPIASRDRTETVQVLAGLSRFVIVDLTEAKSVPQELLAFVPALPSVPVQPIIASGHDAWSMFSDLPRRYAWVLQPYVYADDVALVRDLDAGVIGPALDQRSKQDRVRALETQVSELEAELSALRATRR